MSVRPEEEINVLIFALKIDFSHCTNYYSRKLYVKQFVLSTAKYHLNNYNHSVRLIFVHYEHVLYIKLCNKDVLMSEKSQHTAERMREKMINRYGDEHHHKHNKNHKPYRKHFRSHPCKENTEAKSNATEFESGSTGLLRQFNTKKIRKRVDKGQFH